MHFLSVEIFGCEIAAIEKNAPSLSSVCVANIIDPYTYIIYKAGKRAANK